MTSLDQLSSFDLNEECLLTGSVRPRKCETVVHSVQLMD